MVRWFWWIWRPGADFEGFGPTAAWSDLLDGPIIGVMRCLCFTRSGAESAGHTARIALDLLLIRSALPAELTKPSGKDTLFLTCRGSELQHL